MAVDPYGAGKSAVNSFSTTWSSNTAFWQRANQLDAYLQFCNIADKVWQGQTDYWSSLRNTMLSGNLDYLTSQLSRGYSVYWTDDYGWCGIAGTTAAAYYYRIGKNDMAASWSQLAVTSFKMMAARYDGSTYAKPVPNGVSNLYTKNTVTNANFLVLCMKLYDLLTAHNGPSDIITTLALYATKQAAWFANWSLQQVGSDVPYSYVHGWPVTGMPGALLEERPFTTPAGLDYDPGYTYYSTGNPSWSPGSVWAGDQGLFINASAAYLLRFPQLLELLTPSSTPREIAQMQTQATDLSALLNTIYQGLVYGTFYSNTGTLYDLPIAILWNGDPTDYVCGRGVLSRFLTDPITLQQLGKTYTISFTATALAAVASQDSSGQFSANWGIPSDAQDFATYFKSIWGSQYNYVSSGLWPPYGDGNYSTQCQLNGFDVLTAYLRTNTTEKVVAPEADELANGESQKEERGTVANGSSING